MLLQAANKNLEYILLRDIRGGKTDVAAHRFAGVHAKHAEVKFVLRDRAVYEYARDVVARHRLAVRVAAVLFSPVHGVLDPQALATWILDDHLTVRLQLQLHKYIWSPDTRGV